MPSWYFAFDVDTLSFSSTKTNKKRARKGREAQRPWEKAVFVWCRCAVQYEFPAELCDDDHNGVDYVGLHYREPLLCILERNGAKIPQQWATRLLRAAHDMVYQHCFLLYL